MVLTILDSLPLVKIICMLKTGILAVVLLVTSLCVGQVDCQDHNENYSGDCISYYENGKPKVKGSFKNGEKSGVWKHYTEDGTLNNEVNYNPPPPRLIIVEEEKGDKDDSIEDINGIVEFPEIDAEFRGRKNAFQSWIAKNVRYPYDAIRQNITGRVYLSFVVEKNGAISNVKVEKSVHELLDEEAIRLISTMPRWKPAKVNRKAVRGRCRVPINFTIN